MRDRFFCILLSLAAPLARAADASYQPREGDLVFQSLPHGELVDAIEGISGSHYSHVGIVIRKGNDWYVREAIGVVGESRLADWEARGRYHHAFNVFRLRDDLQHFVPALVRQTGTFLGKPYDYKFDMDDAHIYCSELIYKAMYDASGVRLGQLHKLGELHWQPYRRTIEKYEGGKPPLERAMITPLALSQAPELVEVHHGYKD